MCIYMSLHADNIHIIFLLGIRLEFFESNASRNLMKQQKQQLNKNKRRYILYMYVRMCIGMTKKKQPSCKNTKSLTQKNYFWKCCMQAKSCFCEYLFSKIK